MLTYDLNVNRLPWRTRFRHWRRRVMAYIRAAIREAQQ
jgi:hypothetical protein